MEEIKERLRKLQSQKGRNIIMARQLEKTAVLSILEFCPKNGEEIFLSYTKNFEDGPGIKRDGENAPSMTFPGYKLGEEEMRFFKTQDPVLQRRSCKFIDKDKDMKLSIGDKFILEHVEKGDLFKLVYKPTGGVLFQHAFS